MFRFCTCVCTGFCARKEISGALHTSPSLHQGLLLLLNSCGTPKHSRCCSVPSPSAATPAHPLFFGTLNLKICLNTLNLFLRMFGPSQMNTDSQPVKYLEGEDREYCSFLFILFRTELTHLPGVQGSLWLDNASFNQPGF